ncbi:MAG: 4-(cytidine 5'-diphospho)-2-C-methyl-D-erythritol kinase [Opitutales bacterium]|nr:4-(cytidine 5'-diphospho)-2-C-methyl-D-erythritol kinase [Opitutales bacterium]
MITRFCPAKINLSLRVGPPREDGFHELASLVALLDWGDELSLEWSPGEGPVELEISGSDVPADETNLVYRAAMAFREKFPQLPPVRLHLQKNLPAEAGLGGGSSNAVQTLLGLEALSGERLSDAERIAMAASLGSDCPLFTEGRAVSFFGRGEILQSLPEPLYKKLHRRRVLILKPFFPVSTAWAFQTWRAKAALAADEKQISPETWRHKETERLAKVEQIEGLPNDLISLVAEKYPALPVLGRQLSEEFGLTLQMTGSGSACFVFLPEGFSERDRKAVEAKVKRSWGPDTLLKNAWMY